MNRVCSLRTLVFAIMALMSASLVFGQSDLGSITGFVKDPTGAGVPNAKVTLRNTTGLERTVTTNDTGHYAVTNIPPGTYNITAEAAGFKKFESTNNRLDVASNLGVDLTLAIGSASETIEVTASATQLQTETATVQKNITRQQIDALEMNGRNPVDMARLVPGTRSGNLANTGFGMSQGPSNINGARTQESIITYDGAPAVRTRSNGSGIGAADIDSTQEVQVLTSNYAPEYGRSSGGQIRILTRSGTNAFHGSLYEYFRNNALNANTWSRNHTPDVPGFIPNSTVAPFRFNQFGYNIGGPVFIPGKFNRDRNKYFFYWGQEWVRNRFTDTLSMTVPSLLMRQGNFSELLDPSNKFYGKSIQLNDPTTGKPIPGNIIPASLLSSSGLGILRAYPAPNLGGFVNGSTNYYRTAAHPQNQRKDTLSVDINVTDKQRLQFRRMNYAFFEYQPLDSSGFAPKYFNRPNQTNSLDYVYTISPTVVNEFLATVSLDDVYIPVNQAGFTDRYAAGINYPYLFPQGKLVANRVPTVNWSSVWSGMNGGPYPSHSAGPIYTISDSLTWVKGSHTLKFGFNYERSGENDNDEINVSACPTCTNNQNGQFSFSDTRSGRPTSGVSLANAALGLFDTYSELGQRAYTVFRGSMYEGFAQDSWKTTSRLTVNYGVRYTVNVPYSALWRNMIVFDPKYYDPAKAVKVDPTTGYVTTPAGADRYNGMVIPGSGWPDSAKGRFPEATAGTYDYLFRGGAEPSYYSKIQWGQWQPRVGVAYSLNEKTVLRAGAGRFFTRLGVSDSIFLGGNPPFQPTANITFGSIDQLGNLQSNSVPLTVTTQSKEFKNPESWQWNATVERQVPLNSVLSVAYVGRRGLHLQREADINQPTIATVQAAQAINPNVNLDSLRPYLGYNSIRQTDNVASSIFHSLQVAWNRRFTHGLAFGVAYTFGKSWDSGSNPRDIIPNTYYAGNLWGPSDYDVRHIFIANFLYELPIFRGQHGVAGKLLGGWQVSGIFQAQTGTPTSVATGNDYAGVGQDGNMSGGGQFWNINGDPQITHNIALNGGGKNDPAYWFQTTNADGTPIFTAPGKYTFTTQSVRNRIYNPGFNNWNLGLFKQFKVTEQTGLQFRAEAFNAMNHPNWNGPNTNPTSAQFGQITSKNGDARNMQLSLRFFF